MKRIPLIRTVLCLLFLAAGCASQKTEVVQRYTFGFADRKHYAKIKDGSVTLDLSPGSREFAAGSSVELVFILRNTGKKELKIPEWFKFEPNNLRVQCQVWLPGAKGPDPDMWLDVSAPVKQPIWRYPLSIPAGEAQFVGTKLDFPANLVVSPGAERRYFVRAKLNLTSLTASSPVRTIVFRPGAVSGRPPQNKDNK